MSYTNTITPKYAYNIYTPGVKSFANGANNVVLFDKRHNQNAPVSKTDLQIKQLKEEFKLAKDEQGVIGKAWNSIKNLFKTEYSSSNIEKALNSLNSNSTDEEINNVKNMIAKYRSKQDLAVDTVATTGATIAAGAAGAKVGAMIGSVICPGAGTIVGGILGCIGGAIVGAVAKVGICQLENMTDSVDNNAWHNDKNIGKEVTSGALSGATAMLFGGIAKKVSGACKSALGITKQGVVLAENGTANIAKTVARTALAEGAGGAAASTIIADGEYLVRCATDENTKFSWGDLAQTTGISAVTGGVMGAGFGAITGYKGASNFNKELALNNEIKTSSNTTTDVKTEQDVETSKTIANNISESKQLLTKEECNKLIENYTPIELPGSKFKIKDRITDADELMTALKQMSTPYDTKEIVTQRAKNLIAGRLVVGKGQSVRDIVKDPYLKQIIENAKTNIESANKGKQIFIITGKPASGKSTYIDINKLNKDNGFFLLDSDEIKKLLPGYSTYGANFSHQASATITRAEMEIAIQEGVNIVYPTTGKAINVIESAINNGYAVKVVYCDVPTHTCIGRALNRFLHGIDHRFVDPYYIQIDQNSQSSIQDICNQYGLEMIIHK